VRQVHLAPHTSRVVDLPEAVRRTAESHGSVGEDWLAALPGIVGHLCDAWSLSVGEVLDGGTSAYVARVRTADGSDAVLKVALPARGFSAQVGTLAASAGRGYVRLYDFDLERHAMLMEPLGPPLSAAGAPVEAALSVLANTLLQAWQAPRPPDATIPAPAGKANQLIEIIDDLWPAHGGPCSRRLVTRAGALADRRAEAFDLEGCVLCHGDPHADNALLTLAPRVGAESGYVFVDPDGFLCEPAYDLGVAMRGWTDQLLAADDPIALARSWSTHLAQATDVDEQAIWAWGLIERLTTGLYLTRIGHEAAGRAYLASAELLV
jgi:streptomycin 6-kinase